MGVFFNKKVKDALQSGTHVPVKTPVETPLAGRAERGNQEETTQKSEKTCRFRSFCSVSSHLYMKVQVAARSRKILSRLNCEEPMSCFVGCWDNCFWVSERESNRERGCAFLGNDGSSPL